MHTIAIVLAGGKSSRMGVDKLQLPVGKNTSTTVLHHVLDVCNRVSDEVWLADTTTGESLDDSPCLSLGRPVRRVYDKTAYQGPLQAVSNIWVTLLTERGGKSALAEQDSVLAGQESLRTEQDSVPDSINQDDACVFLVAGDLPGLHEKVLHTCYDILQRAPRDVDAVLVTREGRWQPLIGCYRIRCGLNFARVAQTGEPRLMRALNLLRVIPVATEEEGWSDWWTRPIHTPEEYQQWLDVYHQRSQETESPV